MYHRVERPLTEAEIKTLDTRGRKLKEPVCDGVFALVLVGLIADPMAVFAIVMMIPGKDNGGPFLNNFCPMCLSAVLGLALNLYMLTKISDWWSAIEERKRLKGAIADGGAVVETLLVRDVAIKIDAYGWIHFLRLRGESWCVLRDGLPTDDLLPVLIQVVTSRAHQFFLSHKGLGKSVLSLDYAPDLPRTPALYIVEDPPPVFLCTSEGGNLSEEQMAKATANPAAEYAWAMLQAEIEDSFDIKFGAGGLAEAVREENALTLDALVDVVEKQLPAVCIARTSLPAYRALRDALSRTFQLPSRAVRPSALLKNLMPKHRRGYDRLGKVMCCSLPSVSFGSPPWYALLFCAIASLAWFSLWIVAAQWFDREFPISPSQAWYVKTAHVALGIVGTVFMFYGWFVVLFVPVAAFQGRSLVTFEPGLRSVAEWSKALALTMPACERKIPWNRDLVFFEVRRIVARATHCLPLQLNRATDLSELGFALPAK